MVVLIVEILMSDITVQNLRIQNGGEVCMTDYLKPSF